MLDRLGGMKTAALSAGVGALFTSAAMAGAPAPVVSSFDSDLEGWTAVGFNVDTSIGALLSGNVLSQTDNSLDMVYDSGGDFNAGFVGNPGGFARFTDVIEDPASFASAPGGYLGDLSGFAGGAFSYDHRLFAQGPNAASVGPYVILFISGDPNDLAAYGAVLPGPSLGDADTGWINVSANLTDGGPGGLVPVSQIDLGVFDPSLAGDTAESLSGGLLSTTASFNDVMSNVTQVLVSFEIVDNDSNQNEEFGGIDNVQLRGIPEPGTAALLGLAGLALVRRRRG